MKTYTAAPNQSLLDIAVQLYGDAGRLWELASINGLSPTSAISPGTVIMHNAPASAVASNLKAEGRSIATANNGGIGWVTIGVTNIVN